MQAQNWTRKTIPIANFTAGGSGLEVGWLNNYKGRKLLIRYCYQILQKKYNFFIFSAGDWTADKNEIEADKIQIADKQLIRLENY